MLIPSSEYLALYTYESPEPGDLTFTEGDTILVSEREGEWWRGSIGDRSGVFPSNYVKPKETDVILFLFYSGILAFIHVVSCQTTFFFLIRHQVSLVNLECQGRNQASNSVTFYDNFKVIVLNYSSLNLKHVILFIEVAQVTTAHTAAGAEQLNLSPGQLILILTKNSSGWWLGELQVSELLMHKHFK